jgi:uncharacterized protein YjbI with pentapeptide repeats
MKKFTFINLDYQPKRLKLLGSKIETFAVIRDKDLSNQDFSDRILTNIIFVNCNLQNCNFNSINSENLKFYSCDLTNSTFVCAKLDKPTFSKCTGEGTLFTESIQDSPIYYHSNFSNSIFHGSILLNLRGQYATFCNVDFTTSSINGTFVLIGNFKGADAKPEAGFRTKKGGGEYYKVPVCKQDCKTDPTYCKQPCACNTNPDKTVMPVKFSKH